MTEQPDSSEQTTVKRSLLRAQVAVSLLVILGVGLFVGIWVAMDSAGVDTFPRLMASVCVPPAVLAAIVGTYFLVTSGRNGES